MHTDVSEAELWCRARDALCRRFRALEPGDLILVPGREETLLEAISRKTGRSREEVVDALDALGLFRAG